MKKVLSVFSLVSMFLSVMANAESPNSIKCDAVETSSKRIVQSVTLKPNSAGSMNSKTFEFEGISYDLQIATSNKEFEQDQAEAILNAPVLRASLAKHDVDEKKSEEQVTLATQLTSNINVLAQAFGGHLTLRCSSLMNSN